MHSGQIFYLYDRQYENERHKTIHLQNCLNQLQGKSASHIKKAYNHIKSIMGKAINEEIIVRNRP